MDADSFDAYGLQLFQHPPERSHGMTLNDSHDGGGAVTSSRAQQPPPLVLPQLQNPPLSTPRPASATSSTPIPAGVSGAQHPQPLLIQIPIENGSQPLEASRSTSTNPSTPHQQAQSQALMEAGVVPTAEDKARYEAARKELIQALQKKRAVDRTLAHLEVQIYNFEGSYLSETVTHSGGNIIQGFENYLKQQNTNRRKPEVTDAERVFSNSSLTYQKSLELVMDNEEQQQHNGNPFGGGGGFADDATLALSHSVHGISGASSTGASARGLTPGLTTVVLPPPSTRGASEHAPMTAAQQKKARDKEYQRRKRANAAHMRSQQQAAQVHRDSVGFGREYSTDGGADEGGSVSGRGSSRRPNKRSRPNDDE